MIKNPGVNLEQKILDTIPTTEQWNYLKNGLRYLGDALRRPPQLPTQDRAYTSDLNDYYLRHIAQGDNSGTLYLDTDLGIDVKHLRLFAGYIYSLQDRGIVTTEYYPPRWGSRPFPSLGITRIKSPDSITHLPRPSPPSPHLPPDPSPHHHSSTGSESEEAEFEDTGTALPSPPSGPPPVMPQEPSTTVTSFGIQIADCRMQLRATPDRLAPSQGSPSSSASLPLPPQPLEKCLCLPTPTCGPSILTIGISEDGASIFCPDCLADKALALRYARLNNPSIPLGRRENQDVDGRSLAEYADLARVETPPIPAHQKSTSAVKRARVSKRRAADRDGGQAPPTTRMIKTDNLLSHTTEFADSELTDDQLPSHTAPPTGETPPPRQSPPMPLPPTTGGTRTPHHPMDVTLDPPPPPPVELPYIAPPQLQPPGPPGPPPRKKKKEPPSNSSLPPTAPPAGGPPPPEQRPTMLRPPTTDDAHDDEPPKTKKKKKGYRSKASKHKARTRKPHTQD